METLYHEAALVAAPKLGIWEEEIKIYHTMEKLTVPQSRKVAKTVVGIGMEMVLLVSHIMLFN